MSISNVHDHVHVRYYMIVGEDMQIEMEQFCVMAMAMVTVSTRNI